MSDAHSTCAYPTCTISEPHKHVVVGSPPPARMSEKCQTCKHTTHQRGVCPTVDCVCNIGPWDSGVGTESSRLCSKCSHPYHGDKGPCDGWCSCTGGPRAGGKLFGPPPPPARMTERLSEEEFERLSRLILRDSQAGQDRMAAYDAVLAEARRARESEEILKIVEPPVGSIVVPKSQWDAKDAEIAALKQRNEDLELANDSLNDIRIECDANDAALRAEIAALRGALRDAIEAVKFWSAYADDYYKEKHDPAGDLAKLDAALAGGGREK